VGVPGFGVGLGDAPAGTGVGFTFGDRAGDAEDNVCSRVPFTSRLSLTSTVIFPVFGALSSIGVIHPSVETWSFIGLKSFSLEVIEKR
jgi:hypothetical protein